MSKSQRGRGRPPRPKDEKQGHRIAVNLTAEEYAQVSCDAKQAGLSLASFLADCWRRARTGKKGK